MAKKETLPARAAKNQRALKAPPSGLKWRWFVNSISVILIVLMVISLSAAVGMRVYFYSSVQAVLENRASATSKTLTQYMSGSYSEFYSNSRYMVQDFAELDKMDMQMLNHTGSVDFSASGLVAGFTLETEDVQQALFGTKKMYTFTGYDPLTDEKVMACTAPITNLSGSVIGAVRYVTSLRLLDRQLISIYLIIAAFFVGIAALIIISNSYFLRSIVTPILKINQLAQTIGGGQYGARLDVEFNDEIGDLCKSLNNMSQELARMERLKNDFISSVSHELRTPLTAINGWAETVAHDLDDPAIASSGLDIIKNETNRLAQMVEELLDFSRIEGGRLHLHSEEFDVRGLLYDAVFMYTEMLKSQSLTVRYEEPDDEIIVFGDKNRMKQVFLNIIDNAGKYGAGGEFVDVSVKLREKLCIVTFRDYGQGIPEKELPFVKEKFFKGSARGRGTGIGLAVCNEIIAMHSGELEIESVYGEGTAVHVILPALVTDDEE